MSEPDAYVKWLDEEVEGPTGPRRVRAAWLVRDVTDWFGERREVLAYLGQRPAITATLEEEITALFPGLTVDWAAIRRAISADSGFTNAQALTDDELAVRLRALAHERGMSLMDLALRLGYHQRQVLPEVVALIEDEGRAARYERTSGSIFDYLAEKHPEYAFALYRARLFFEGEDAALQETIAAEPPGFGDAAWKARRQFWKDRLETYRRSRRAPDMSDLDHD
jgi:hypothetical protein